MELQRRLYRYRARDLPYRPAEGGHEQCRGIPRLSTRPRLATAKGSDLPIYSDSRNAISWVKEKKCKTLLARKPINEPIFDLIRRAEKWLNTHTYTTPDPQMGNIRMGEIPADFGRK